MDRQPTGALPVIAVVQSPLAGLTPYAGGAHLLEDTLHHLPEGRRCALIDLRLAPARSGDPGPNLDDWVESLTQDIERLGAGPVHLVGHDFGGLLALLVALRHPEVLACATIVASAWASPSGDGVDNLALLSPPAPRWEAHSQRWALERLSYSHGHVSDSLVARCVEAARRPQHQALAHALQNEARATQLMAQIMRAKFGIYHAARGQGVTVPTQVIAATHDPLVSADQMRALFQLLAARQQRTQFHWVNRSGNLIFRDQPREFYRLLAAFGEGLAAEA